ncbi:MAG: PAS domain S-box protein [Chloroflexales bacterium]|nr:PAS domain S-box protein [Chloroflexales bacterium]
MIDASHSDPWPAEDPLFREVWETSPDAMALSDAAGVVLLANPAYFRLYAYSPQEVIGRDFAIIFPQEQREAARQAYRAIFEAARPVEGVEAVVVCGDGTLRTVESRATFIERGERRYMLSLMRDIQAVKAAQAAIEGLNRSLEARVSERTAQLADTVQELLQEISARAFIQAKLQSVLRLQRAILDSASYAIIATGLDGTIRSFNHAAERMLGYSADAVIGRATILSFHDPDELRGRADDLARMLGVAIDFVHGILHPVVACEQPYEAEWTYRRADGTTLPVSVSLTTLRDDDGQPEGFLSIVSDISQRKLVEEALRQANSELVRASHLKDEFLANMSHELRTPLNAILGRTEVLQEQIFGELNERQLRSIRSVEESGRDLLALINDILDVAKIEAGRIELELEPCDVQMLCSASMRLVTETAQKKHISIRLQIDSGVTRIHADQRRLKQILVNLLSNAVKFTPVGGSIGFEVHSDRQAEEISFVVWDTGIGIALEDQSRLFQPFVQIDSSLSRQYAGTGLGLSLVHRLTQMHGGRVDLESTPGQGSRFSVILPWHLSAHPGLRPAAETPDFADSLTLKELSSPSAILVLLADDSPENIELMREYLEALHYRVAVASSGDEALAMAAAIRPAIILMDIQMPGMNGLEAIKRIRAHPDTFHTPIIALTALAMVGDHERCLAAGASEYVSKPASLKQLAAMIARYTQPAPGVGGRG